MTVNGSTLTFLQLYNPLPPTYPILIEKKKKGITTTSILFPVTDDVTNTA